MVIVTSCHCTYTKKIFPRITSEQLAATNNESVQLKMYNKTSTTQLGTYAVEIEHKGNKKRCKIFIVPRNGQALLGMPDMDMLNIIKVNIHAIGTEQTGDSDNCCTNRPTSQREDTKQETDRAEKCYTKTDRISKLTTKNKPMVDNEITNTVEYFISGPSCDSGKKRVLKSHSNYKGTLKMYLMALGTLMAHFCCS